MRLLVGGQPVETRTGETGGSVTGNPCRSRTGPRRGEPRSATDRSRCSSAWRPWPSGTFDDSEGYLRQAIQQNTAAGARPWATRAELLLVEAVRVPGDDRAAGELACSRRMAVFWPTGSTPWHARPSPPARPTEAAGRLAREQRRLPESPEPAEVEAFTAALSTSRDRAMPLLGGLRAAALTGAGSVVVATTSAAAVALSISPWCKVRRCSAKSGQSAPMLSAA
jgi:hypothetical protein